MRSRTSHNYTAREISHQPQLYSTRDLASVTIIQHVRSRISHHYTACEISHQPQLYSTRDLASATIVKKVRSCISHNYTAHQISRISYTQQNYISHCNQLQFYSKINSIGSDPINEHKYSFIRYSNQHVCARSAHQPFHR